MITPRWIRRLFGRKGGPFATRPPPRQQIAAGLADALIAYAQRIINAVG